MTEPVTGPALGVVIAGLALTTFVTRTSFLVAGARLKLGSRIEAALRYAPVCTLAAIVVPDVLQHGGHLDMTPLNPRLIGVLGTALFLTVSRNVAGCLASGMLAYSLARILL